MQIVVRTSPDRLATRYGLLAGGANALLVLAVFVTARSGISVLTTAFASLLGPVLLGSAVLVVQLGYMSGRQGGTTGMAAGLGFKAGILYGLVASVGALVSLAGADLLFYANSLSPAGLVASVLMSLVSAVLASIFLGLVGAALAMLGAAVAQRRARA